MIINENSNVKEMLNRAIFLNNQIKQMEDELKNLKNELNKAVPDGVITDANGVSLYEWKVYEAMAKFNSSALKKEMPEIYEKYVTFGEPYVKTFIKAKTEIV